MSFLKFTIKPSRIGINLRKKSILSTFISKEHFRLVINSHLTLEKYKTRTHDLIRCVLEKGQKSLNVYNSINSNSSIPIDLQVLDQQGQDHKVNQFLRNNVYLLKAVQIIQSNC